MFEYLRNYELNAANFFLRPRRRQAEPVRIQRRRSRDAAEALQRQGSHLHFWLVPGNPPTDGHTGRSSSTTPTEAMKRGDFSEWLRPDGTGADPRSAGAHPVFPGQHHSHLPLRSRLRANCWISCLPPRWDRLSVALRHARSDRQYDDQIVLRLDHQISPKQRISFRNFYLWFDTPWSFAPDNLYFVTPGKKAIRRTALSTIRTWPRAKWLNDFTASMNSTRVEFLSAARAGPRSPCRRWARESRCCPISRT